jgi:hypothetical protein
MSAAKKPRITIPPDPTIVYNSSAEIVQGLRAQLAKLPSSGGPASLGPMSGEITVFLVSFGKFRLVQRGHKELWNKLVEAARDILNDPYLKDRVNVCIDISSYDTATECPADGGMGYIDLGEYEKLSDRLKGTVNAKKVFCERSVPNDKRIQDIRTTLKSLLVTNGIATNANLTNSVTSTPFNIINPQFSAPSCSTLRDACDAPGLENKCLIISVGGSDRVGGGGNDDLIGKFMVKSSVPHGLLRVGESRVVGTKTHTLLELVEWVIKWPPVATMQDEDVRKVLEPYEDGDNSKLARPELDSLYEQIAHANLKIPMAAFSSSFIDYTVDMCLWACVPKLIIERIIAVTTIHSDPASIVETKAMQMKARIHNVLELRKHAIILRKRQKPIEPGLSKAAEKRILKSNREIAEAYNRPAAGTPAVMQYMSYKMVIDSLMLEHMTATNVSSDGRLAYQKFTGRVPSHEDFGRLLSWNQGRWWKNEKDDSEEAADNVRVVIAIAQALAAGGIPASCNWWLGGLAGGRRITRKRKRRHPMHSASGTRRERRKASRIRRRKTRIANALRKS